MAGIQGIAVILLVLGSLAAARSPLTSDQDLNVRLPRNHPPEANLTTPELIALHGYPVEIHHVTTSDGYILEMHRIPHGVKTTSEAAEGPRPVAFLHHCLLCSSADWIMNTPDKALAYLLADAGYDVWMANARGNTYSRRHETLLPSQRKFWQFSWDHIAAYDVPAEIDYVLETTGQKDLYYVGFSMGTTVFFAMMNEHPEYNEKIRVMIAMGPAAYMEHAKGLFREMAPYTNDIENFLDLFGMHEFLPSSELMDKFVEKYCDAENQHVDYCYNFLFLLSGADPEQLNKDYLPVILAHTPAGTSTHTFAQFGQEMMSGRFCKYDYGRLGNMIHYNQKEPPSYTLDKVTTPVALYYGLNDYLAAPEDALRVAAELPNLIVSQAVDHPQFSHLDFVWALDADKLVYKYVLEVLSHY